MVKGLENLILLALKMNKINSLVHIGGHIGQEVNFYNSLNLDKAIFLNQLMNSQM